MSQNEAWIDEMKRISGVRIAPVTVIGNEVFFGTFERQRRGLEQALALWNRNVHPDGTV